MIHTLTTSGFIYYVQHYRDRLELQYQRQKAAKLLVALVLMLGLAATIFLVSIL